jgi:parallel beta-helix repeat protein
MKRTISSLGIILILLLSSLSFTTIGIEDVTSTVIYVDDDGDGDYTCIQDAIDNASDGDIIYVYSGTYNPFSVINWTKFQPIRNLIIKGISQELNEGNGIGKPRIIGHIHFDRLIYLLYAINCTIEGFNLSSGLRGIHLIDSYNNTIKNNTIHSCEEGMELEYYGRLETNNNIIENNIIDDCFRGIFLEQAFQNTVIGNCISNCSYGIDNQGDGNIFLYNKIISNGEYSVWGEVFGEGIRSLGDNSVFEMNYFKGNTYGLTICSKNNTIRFNNFLDKKEEHAYFYFLFSNTWDGNYWDDWWGFGPKIIKGYLWEYYHILWFTLDRHPAREPYDIQIDDF